MYIYSNPKLIKEKKEVNVQKRDKSVFMVMRIATLIRQVLAKPTQMQTVATDNTLNLFSKMATRSVPQ